MKEPSEPRWFFQREKARKSGNRAIDRLVKHRQKENRDAEEARLFRARELSGRLYFIQCATGPIKIGHTSNTDNRLSNLQMGNPNLLTLLAWVMVDDAPAVEKMLHERYREHWIRGEWFSPAPEILELAKKCATIQANAVSELLRRPQVDR